MAFALALVIPMLAFAGFLVWRFAEVEETRITEQADRSAQQVTLSIDRELSGIIGTLQALATSPSLQVADYAVFYQQARQVARGAGTRIALRDLEGRQLLNTGLPFGSPLPTENEAESLGQAVSTRQPHVSDLVISSVTRRPIVMVNVPVMLGDTVSSVLSLILPADHMLGLLRQNILDPAGSVGLIDRKGVFIARLRNHDQFVGKSAGEDLLALSGDRGSVVRTNVLGEEVLFIYQRTATAGWLIGVGVPTEALRRPLWESLAIVFAAGSLLLALSLTLAAALGRRIARPIRTLSFAAARMGRGDVVEPLATGVREVDEVGGSLSAASIGLRERSQALRVSEERYRLATEAFQGAVFDYDPEANRAERTPRHYEMLGEAPGAVPTSREGWRDRIHPEDQTAYDRARQEMYDSGAPLYDVEYRVRRKDGSWLWVWHRAMALRDADGKLRRVLGAVLDITDRRQAEERLKLLINELNHRVKNTLATVQSIAAQSLRGAASVEQGKATFEARLLALSRAHNILTDANWEGAGLRSLVTDTLEPHQVRWADRFSIDGPDVWVTPGNAVALAMALHELATNAAKYGALTSAMGRVSVSWHIEKDREPKRVRLSWVESGGPPVIAPTRRGFGSRLIARSFADDPAGEVRMDYRPEGLVCTLAWAVTPDQPDLAPALAAAK